MLANDGIFRIIFALVLILMACIRGYYHRITIMKALHGSSSGDAITFRESCLNMALCSILGFLLLTMLVEYIAYPQWMAWSALPLPVWLRWTGAGLAVLGLLLMLWTHHTLGENFSATLHLREQHIHRAGLHYGADARCCLAYQARGDGNDREVWRPLSRVYEPYRPFFAALEPLNGFYRVSSRDWSAGLLTCLCFQTRYMNSSPQLRKPLVVKPWTMMTASRERGWGCTM